MKPTHSHCSPNPGFLHYPLKIQGTNYLWSLQQFWVFDCHVSSCMCARWGGRREGISINESQSFSCKKMKFCFFGKSEFSLILPAGGSPFSRGIWPFSQCAKPLWVSTSRVSFSQDQTPNMQHSLLSKYSMSTAQATWSGPGFLAFTFPICWLLA